jgi:hypothetical protein
MLSFEGSLTADGNPDSFQVVGTIAYFIVVQVSSYVIFLIMKDWTFLFVIITILSCLAFLPFIIFYDFVGVPTKVMIGVTDQIFAVPNIFVVLFTPLICVFILLVERYVMALFYPGEVDKIREK